MSKFKPKLARYNTGCCAQVMPVPVIPKCAVSCSIPIPFWVLQQQQLQQQYDQYYQQYVQQVQESQQQQQQQQQQPQQTNTECTSCQQSTSNYLPIESYPPATTPQVGQILTNTTGTTPDGYLLCDGSEVSRTTYAALFSVIGEAFGNGDGSTTFNLPNLSNSCVNDATYILKT